MAGAPAFDPNQPFDPLPAEGGGSAAPPFDPNKPFEPAGAAPPLTGANAYMASLAPNFLPDAITDIPHEIYNAGADAISSIARSFTAPARGFGPADQWARFKDVGASLEGVAGLAGAPVTGAARSLIGHPLSDLASATNRLAGYPDLPGIPYDKAKEAVDLALSAAGPKSARSPVPLPTAPVPDALGVTLSEGQRTGDLPLIRNEQSALNERLGPSAEAHAKDFATQQGQQLDTAADQIRAGLDPLGQIMAQSPQQAAGLVSDALTSAESHRGALTAQDAGSLSSGIDQLPHPLDAADTVANSLRDVHQSGVAATDLRNQQVVAQREAIRGSLNPSGGVIANSPQEAADIISGAVGNQAELAQAATRDAYQQLRDLPGDFHPATFSGIGESIRSTLNAGTEPIRVNPHTTPIANQALGDLDEILGEIGQQRGDNGKLLPREPVTPAQLDDTRKRLNTFYGDAIAAARSSNNFSDVRAMRGIMSAFDDYVATKLDRGAFRGDAANVQQTMQNARALNTSYRRTFTPQGAGDTVGSAIQNIVGRYDGQAAPPSQIAQWLYGPGALPTKIATRLLGIFGEGGAEASALRQGYLSNIVERPNGVTAWGPNQIADRIYNALNGPGRALSEIYFSPQVRNALRNYADSLRGTVEAPTPTADVVTRSINRIVGSGAQPATSAEVSDLLFGRNAVGSNPIGVKLAQHIRDTQGPQSPAFTALRQGVMAKLTNASAGRLGFDAEATAQRMRSFLDAGRPMAETLFSPDELKALDQYATNLEQHAASVALPKDEVERTLARIGGRDGQAPATPTEVADLLYGRSGLGDRGTSVRLIQRLKGELGEGSPHWSAVKQGMFSRLIEPAEGRLDWGPQKISERMHEFLNGNGRPLAEEMYAPAERQLLQQFADLQKKLIVPPGGGNPSGTSTFMAPMLRKVSATLAGLVGAVIGHAIAPGLYGAGEFAGATVAAKSSQAISNFRNARQIARQMPLVGQAMRNYQRALTKAQRANAPISGPALAIGYANLARSLRPMGIDLGQISVQGSAPAQANQEQHQRGGRINNEPDQGEGGQQNGFAHGGRVDARNINHTPTEAQKEAGNYAKDHVRIHGLDITIENAKGAARSGVDRDGKPWSVKMPAHYGYIKGTVGNDKDHVDVYVGQHPKSPHVFVVDQMDAETGKFDEHKALLGFASREQAKRTYLAGFSDGKGARRLGHMGEMPIEAFKDWLANGNTTKPIEAHTTEAVHFKDGSEIGLAQNPPGIHFQCRTCKYNPEPGGICHNPNPVLKGRKIKPLWCCNLYQHAGMKIIV